MVAPPFHMLMRVKGRCSLSVLDSYDEIIGTRIAAKLEEVGENVACNSPRYGKAVW